MKRYLQKVRNPPEEVRSQKSHPEKKKNCFPFVKGLGLGLPFPNPNPPPDLLQDCTICMEALAGPSGYKGPGVGGISRAESVGRLVQCGHQYHLQCLVAMYNNGNKDGSLQCPTCKTIHGVKTGNQPPGKMEYHVIPHSLPGHPDCKTIRIIYNIPPGIQVQSPTVVVFL